MRNYRVLGMILASGILAGPLWAWGGVGHETVCQIAFLELTPTAKAAVLEIMSHEQKRKYKTLRKGCTWPDGTEPHRDSSARATRKNDGSHFINLPRGETSIAQDTCPQASTCLFTAIAKDRNTLESASATDRDKVTALKFLGHWLGDIHQPLHVSYQDDRGGNKVLLKNSLGCSKNLHTVWDTCIPQDRMGERGLTHAKTEEFAKELHDEITAAERASWSATTDPAEWATESLKQARKASVQYCTLVGQECRYTSTRKVFTPGTQPRKITLDDAYEDGHGEVIETRLKQGGVRLGALLNEIFGN